MRTKVHYTIYLVAVCTDVYKCPWRRDPFVSVGVALLHWIETEGLPVAREPRWTMTLAVTECAERIHPFLPVARPSRLHRTGRSRCPRSRHACRTRWLCASVPRPFRPFLFCDFRGFAGTAVHPEHLPWRVRDLPSCERRTSREYGINLNTTRRAGEGTHRSPWRNSHALGPFGV